MPKNNNQASTLDELEAKMQEEQQQEANNPESNNPEMEQEQQQSKYTPAENEKHLYHIELEKPLYDSKTGKRMSVPYVQKMTKGEYKSFVGKRNEKDKSNAEMLGYSVKVLWNPEENI